MPSSIFLPEEVRFIVWFCGGCLDIPQMDQIRPFFSGRNGTLCHPLIDSGTNRNSMIIPNERKRGQFLSKNKIVWVDDLLCFL